MQGGAGAPLLVLGHVRDDRELVHLRPRGREGEHRVDGQGLVCLGAVKHQVPGVTVVEGTRGDDLCRVYGGAAADGQHHLQAALPAEVDATAHGLDSWVGLHAGQLRHLHAGLGKDAQGLVVDAVALDGAAAVDQQRLGARLRKLTQVADGTLAKVDAGGNVVGEVVHDLSFSLTVGSGPARRLPSVLVPTRPSFVTSWGENRDESCELAWRSPQRRRQRVPHDGHCFCIMHKYA